MANEINIQAALAYNRSSGSVAVSASSDIDSSASTKKGILNIQSIATGGTALDIGGLSTTGGGYIFIKNLDNTNFIRVGIDSGYTTFFAKVRKQECLVLPIMDSATYYAKADTASVYAQVGFVEK